MGINSKVAEGVQVEEAYEAQYASVEGDDLCVSEPKYVVCHEFIGQDDREAASLVSKVGERWIRM
ncbi:hypothetical protein Pmar_PMAR026119, partial [Perkinsus marinus ATCC 50983]